MSRQIKIFQTELDTPEKSDKFRRLFGQSQYIKALQQISQQRYGDGMLEKLEEIAGRLDLNTDEGEKAYENLRPKMQAEQAKLKSEKNAYAVLDLDHWTSIPPEREKLFRDYLGDNRFYKAMGLEGKEAATNKALLELNPHTSTYQKRKKKAAQKRADQVHKEQRQKSEAAEEAQKIAED
jgi:hypothetical protein